MHTHMKTHKQIYKHMHAYEHARTPTSLNAHNVAEQACYILIEGIVLQGPAPACSSCVGSDGFEDTCHSSPRPNSRSCAAKSPGRGVSCLCRESSRVVHDGGQKTSLPCTNWDQAVHMWPRIESVCAGFEPTVLGYSTEYWHPVGPRS